MSDRSSHKSVPPEPPAHPSDQGDDPGPPSTASRKPQSTTQEGSSAAGPRSSNAQLTVISARQPTGAVSPTRTVPPLESASQLEGEQLGQFLLQKFIGGGGMGVVFRALDTTLNREVAVKVLSRDQSADEEALRRFRNEAQSAARLNHENIAHVHFVGEDRGVHYIVFEFIEGTNLRDRVEQQGPLPLGEAVSYTYQIALALDHASQRDVIHRDIKPSNVLITNDGKAKLVDMGLARLNQVAHTDNELTASGVTLGTFDYISPEQARDPRSADVRSDLYSLGCSFFFMLTGRPPFPEGTVLQKLLQHQADHPPDPRTSRPELPVEVTWLLSRLLAKNPAQRFQLPGQLAHELARFGESLGLHLRADPTVLVQPQADGWLARWQHHLPWAVPLAALFLIVLVMDVIWSPSPVDPAIATLPPPTEVPTDTPTLPPSSAADTPAPLAPKPANVPPDVGPLTPPADRSVPRAPPIEPDDPTTAADDDADPGLLQRAADALRATLDVDELRARAAAVPPSQTDIGPPSTTLDRRDSNPNNATQQSVPPDDRSNAEPAPAADGRLVVSPTEQGENIYASLRAACNNAQDGDVIELRFNGQIIEEPITISNVSISIRAADDHRPVVAFRPKANPVEYPPSMVSVVGGQLRAANVHWELDLDVPGPWALFETRRAELLEFSQCSFTIRNASLDGTTFHPDVAFFDVKGSPGGARPSTEPADDSPVTIEREKCVARGEATFLRDNELQPLRLNWNNGLLATSERLLEAEGGSTEPRQSGGYLRLDLRHVTAMLQRGLALLTNSQDAPYQLPVEIHTDDCILATLSDPPLIEQRGSSDIDHYQNMIQWSGQRNFFTGYEIFWRIATEATAPAAEQMDFDAWQDSTANRMQATHNVSLAWRRLPGYDRPFSAHTPHDYTLTDDDRGRPNLAVGSALDGTDAGCLRRQISMLPIEPTESSRDVTPDDEFQPFQPEPSDD